MADIAGVWKRSAVAERAIVALGVVFTAQAAAAQPSLGWALPLQRSGVGRRITELTFGTLEATRAMFRTVTPRGRPKRRYNHPHRESFLEDAAMSREMLRL
jgi:hypothetical protein